MTENIADKCRWNYPQICSVNTKQSCLILNTIDFQSAKDGNISPEDTSVFSQGPYWSEKAWTSFSQRIILGITTNPCRNSDTIREKIIRETTRKMEAGELF